MGNNNQVKIKFGKLIEGNKYDYICEELFNGSIKDIVEIQEFVSKKLATDTRLRNMLVAIEIMDITEFKRLDFYVLENYGPYKNPTGEGSNPVDDGMGM